MEEGALEHGLQQAELLLGGHLASLLQFGLETLHRLQGTLCVCEPSNSSVTAPGPGVKEWMQGRGRDRGGERSGDGGVYQCRAEIARQGRVCVEMTSSIGLIPSFNLTFISLLIIYSCA